MRILSFTKMWDKLRLPEFTTFRLPRADAWKGRDWHEGETVQVYFHNRRPDREHLGNATIIKKEPALFCQIDDEQAIADGFSDAGDMYDWMCSSHHTEIDPYSFRLNKLTLKWCK